MKEYLLKVSPQHSGERVDLLLTEFFKESQSGLSRTFIQGLIQKGFVKIGDSKITKPHYRVKADEELKVTVDRVELNNLPEPEDIPLDVVYEDSDLAVINKPAGLVVHPGAGNLQHTLVNALLFRFTSLSDINPFRPGIVHRLDKETSGLLVIAKNNFTHLELAKQFARHSIMRKYIAVVKGRMEFDENVIELPIARHATKRKNMAVSFADKARFAKTYYRTKARFKDSSQLELEPHTGRTHQLRVHLAFLGHPILGDKKYSKGDYKRLMLHAKEIGFIHPRTKKFMEFSSEIPPEFKEFLD